MTALKIAFWACLVLVAYTYVGYGLLLWLIVKAKRLMFGREVLPPLPTGTELPSVTLMICAYNEEDVVHEKMKNIRQLRYPQDKLCVMWVTDGSNDGSNNLLRQYPEVKLVYSPERRGKAAAMQHGLRENESEIVVFTDANTMLNDEAIEEIVRQMLRPGVSCVSGEKRVAARTPDNDNQKDPNTAATGGNSQVFTTAEASGQVAAEGEGLYWKYESTLKRWDSELYSAMGAAGELFAVRMSDYRQAPQNALLDDFMMSMLILADGHKIAYTSKAYACEYGSASMQEESKRKKRIAAGGLQSSWWLRRLMNPFRHPKVFFQFISHRVLRWTITPFALVALLPLNIALVATSAGVIYTVVLYMQAAFYAAALAGWWLAAHGRKSRLLYVPYYFLFMNMNVFLGIHYLTTHNTSGTWEKARRG
jgi:cellulose synthase/poly-beta-1,6-N-acetylglucosamine synthase-like glycosyltransferase